MDNIKYLPDGRKVAVIGKINKTEYIVQEIYVAEDNSELPSGDNFTTKTLLDQPAQSWKEKELAKAELQKKKLDEEIASLQKQKSKLNSERQASSLILTSNQKFIDLFNGHDVGFIADVLTGNVKYVITNDYSGTGFDVQTFEDGMYSYDCNWNERSFEGIRMLTVMGIKGSRYTGEQKFRTMINSYPDGSGSKNEATFLKDEAAVRLELERRMNLKLEESKDKVIYPLSIADIKKLQVWITVPKDIVQAAYDNEKKVIETYYNNAVKQAEEQCTKRLQELG
jgi:hypothetical protein